MKSDVAQKEEEILAFWQENQIFEKSLEKPAPKGEFVFFDGPPFATGLPHYGHILASTIKDVIPRYKTMQGFHVPRRWGWDCHGLPIENIVEKELGFKHKKDIKEYGVEKFNEQCREKVLTYAHEWEKIIPRMGRFVDMKDSYRTMDKTFMESVWWVFKQLYDKGLVYEDYRSMHICPRCETTLSQQEVSEGYKDVKDISVTVKFKIKGVENGYFLAWTTTPWTLPGNVALAVGKDIVYVEAKVGDDILVLAKDRLSILTESYEIVAEHKGSEMVGMEYEPPFDYYITDTTLKNHQNGWKVYAADFVTADAGTGIAHEAPAFGADDWELAKQVNLPFVQHVSMDGTIKPEVTAFAGMEVKPKSDDDKVRLGTDIAVLKYLQEHGTFFSKENITHSYPHCWRCDTPLLNYATSSWFVSVSKIKDGLLKNAEHINWSPAHVKDGRFGKWLEGARDWGISRQRFWASAIPLWSNTKGEFRAIGSIDELKSLTKKSGNTYFVMRHGETEGNVKKIWSTDDHQPDPLTDQGKKEVEQSTKHFSGASIDVIIASPYPRTQETARLFAEHIGLSTEMIKTDPRLGEWNVGTNYNGQPIEDFFAKRNASTDRYTFKDDGGESYMDVLKRSGEFLYDIEKEYSGKNILIVSHGAPTRAISLVAGGYSSHKLFDHTRDFRNFDNAEIRQIDFVPLPHNGNYEVDLHKPYIDNVALVDEKGDTLTRVSDVLDTWFDSGSMPYGKSHYPFENKEAFEASFPAQFIAEGVDQTRSWFYYLHVLGGAIFDTNAFQNVIVNGTVLAEDGKKMSKKLQNYPDPMEVVDKYSADALRYYVLSSSLVKAEDLNFSEKGVDEVMKKVFNPLANIVAFYELYVDSQKSKVKSQKFESEHVLDRWIVARLNQLVGEGTGSLEKYQIFESVRAIRDFVNDFSTWYVRRSRDRFKSDNEEEKNVALSTTGFVLLELAKYMAPFTPFFAEDVYQKVKSAHDPISVHLCDWSTTKKVDSGLVTDMQKVRETVTLVLEARSKAGIKVRQPLAALVVKEHLSFELLNILAEEVNVKEAIVDATMEVPFELDTHVTPELQKEGNVRDIIRAIQEARKVAQLTPSEVVTLRVHTDEAGKKFIEENIEAIKKPTNVGECVFEENGGEEFEVEGMKFKVEIVK